MTLKIEDFHWIDELVDKIIGKHGVYPEEVESARSMSSEEKTRFRKIRGLV